MECLNKKILLSIVIPIYKKERYLKKCIDSLLNVLKGFEDRYEIILVDDGSPDKCGEICDAYSRQCSNIMTIHKANQGVSAARNDGVARARGEYVTFIDADDYVTSDMVKVFVALETNPEINVFQFGYKEVNEYGDEIKTHSYKQNGVLNINSNVWRKNANIPSVCIKIVRKSFLVENEIEFPIGIRNGEDWVWTIWICLATGNVFVSDVNYYRYLVERETTALMGVSALKDCLDGCKRSYELIKKYQLPPKTKKYFKGFISLQSAFAREYNNSKSKSERREIRDYCKANKNMMFFPHYKKIHHKLVWLMCKTIGLRLMSIIPM